MKYLVSFGRFWYDFIVGDDWRLALGVLVVLGGGFAAAHHGIAVWWAAPVLVAALLAWSVSRAARPAAPPRPPAQAED
ncbi:MAG TPA: hypothetical protein VHA73_05210 [Acidimicrobiales bacterium]|jgi:hypothetical protein|nr:hypothetical protein [Acidimicrobiales bacterium]